MGRGESRVLLETKLILFNTNVGGLLSWPMASVLDSGLPFRCSQVKVSFPPAQVVLSKGWWLQGPGLVHLVEIIPLLSHIWLFATPWTVAHLALLSMRFPRQEYCNRLLFPPPGDLPDPRIEPASPVSPALVGRFFTLWASREALVEIIMNT